jgi:hypothetical protein
MIVYEVWSENLTEVGGPMGTAKTWVNWSKTCDSLATAKDFARKDYRSRHPGQNLEWIQGKCNTWRTRDLGYVMYHIAQRNVLTIHDLFDFDPKKESRE